MATNQFKVKHHEIGYIMLHSHDLRPMQHSNPSRFGLIAPCGALPSPHAPPFLPCLLLPSALVHIDPAIVGVRGPPPSRDQLLQVIPS